MKGINKSESFKTDLNWIWDEHLSTSEVNKKFNFDNGNILIHFENRFCLKFSFFAILFLMQQKINVWIHFKLFFGSIVTFIIELSIFVKYEFESSLKLKTYKCF